MGKRGHSEEEILRVLRERIHACEPEDQEQDQGYRHERRNYHNRQLVAFHLLILSHAIKSSS
jgi:hypothetical protein